MWEGRPVVAGISDLPEKSTGPVRDGQGTDADVAGTLMPASLDWPLGAEGKPVHDLFRAAPDGESA